MKPRREKGEKGRCPGREETGRDLGRELWDPLSNQTQAGYDITSPQFV